ncbi:hypothetical protein EDB85DRAFT_1893466 [Lactarius pseudohatsudake]|nr:hypothetical protein EDB85DRAFT_1893466 [Lactarius pseudohatsudake]
MAIGVVFARPTCTVIAPWLCRGHAIIHAIIAPLSHIFAPSVVIVRVVVGWLAPHHMCHWVGLTSEWWWRLAVGVHVWEWQKKKGLAEAESAAWESVAFAHQPPPLLQGQHCRHAIHHTTTPCPLAPTPPTAAGLWPLKDIPKSPWPPLPPLSSTQPVAATSNPSPRTSSPPPPPLTVCKSCRNATTAWHATPTAMTPTTTVKRRREQHGGRNNGDAGKANNDGDGV